ncbi:MAG TPA: WXG100 family type VII secretion target [Actinophytocola sp.]|uniref:WXG100 family type VII secretion target n=1 Tax=Actinophytocola sp. TaxID=1872138 RepID=UPI002DDCB478|nr:WXG100 family type VII secretion target [Actinophytocola sp.]HEV2777933.1 WXG100 family type VII secretion target [Actinophytocola sp.]
MPDGVATSVSPTTTATSGAGIVESYSSLVTSITSDAESEGERCVDVALSAAGVVTDTVGFAIDPLGSILTAGVGWLLEHVSFLREPLDALLGNPDEINANIDALKTAAAEMRTIAEEHRQDLTTVADWTGDAANAYNASMRQLAEELDSMGMTLDGTAAVVGVSGMLVTTLRGIVFDIISTVIAELIRGALIALASAAVTFGGSIAAYCGYAGARAAMTASKIAGKISKLLGGLGRQAGRLAELGRAMQRLADGLDRFATAGDLAYGTYQAVKPYETPAPETTR